LLATKWNKSNFPLKLQSFSEYAVVEIEKSQTDKATTWIICTGCITRLFTPAR